MFLEGRARGYQLLRAFHWHPQLAADLGGGERAPSERIEEPKLNRGQERPRAHEAEAHVVQASCAEPWLRAHPASSPTSTPPSSARTLTSALGHFASDLKPLRTLLQA